MSLEFSHAIHDEQLRNTCGIWINSARKEAWVGFKDGSIRGYDLGTNQLRFRSREHSGLVVRVLCWLSHRLMISVGIDGAIIFWTAGGLAADKVHLGEPIYNAAIHMKKFLAVATKSGLKLFHLDGHRLCGHYIVLDRVKTFAPHKDLVRSIATQDSRLYSGAMDGTFVIYEPGHAAELQPSHVVRRAHGAGIVCIEPCRNIGEESGIVATGSYDRHVKIWTNNAQLLFVISGFDGAVFGLAYVRLTNQLWVTCQGALFTVLDPRTGEIISDSCDAWQKFKHECTLNKRHQILPYICYSRELEIMATVCDPGYIVHWFYNAKACLMSIPCESPCEDLAFTTKEPVIFFSCHPNGHLLKWEKAGLQTSKYTNEKLKIQKKMAHGVAPFSNCMDLAAGDSQIEQIEKLPVTPSTFVKGTDWNSPELRSDSVKVEPTRPCQKLKWIHNLDALAVADEQGVVYIWTYGKTTKDTSSRQELSKLELTTFGSARKNASMASPSLQSAISSARSKSAVSLNLLDSGSTQSLAVQSSISSPVGSADYRLFLNRASEFTCSFILYGHDLCVSAMDYVHDQEQNLHILVTSSWDRRIVLWNVVTGQVIGTCRREKSESKIVEDWENADEAELVACEAITDISYSSARNELAYCSRDAHIYVRKFTNTGRKMKLVGGWLAHKDEVLQVKWSDRDGTWLSSGRDFTIRVWSATEPGTRLRVLHCDKPAHIISFDLDFGWILVACNDQICVYDPRDYSLQRVYNGHRGQITALAHVHNLHSDSCYVTSGIDSTIKIWRVYKPTTPK